MEESSLACHKGNAISCQTVGQQLREIAVPVGDVHATVVSLLRAQLSDAIAQDHQTLVDVVCLL